MSSKRKGVIHGSTAAEMLCQCHELQILFDISSALHSSPRLKDVLQQALMAILTTLQFKMGAIYLLKETAEDLWYFALSAYHGFSAALVHHIHDLTLPGQRFENLANQHSASWFSPERVVFPGLQERMIEEGIDEIICIPLVSQKNVLGLLYVTNDGVLQVRPERSAFLTTLGQQIGAAIQNAQLFESVQRAKSELEISFDAIQHSIFVVDHLRRILHVNRTSEEVYGKAETLVGRFYPGVLYQTADPVPDCPIEKCLLQKQTVQQQGPHPQWGGYYHYSVFPVLNQDGSLERVVYYEKDVTETRRLEQRLQQSERLKALGTLAAGIAHEIRNPLATINFNAQMLHRELSLDGAQEQMLSDLLLEIKKIDRIVQQVLNFAKPREPQFLSNQLNDVVRYCHDLARVHMRKGSIDVVLELAEGLPPLIMDFNQVSQVIMNLVINAVEAMPDGGNLLLRTSLQDEPPGLRLQVSDTGIGIIPEDGDRIFDPFFTRKSDGTGLGLSICRQILEQHGAHMEVTSAPGAGTTFHVIFPLVSLGVTDR